MRFEDYTKDQQKAIVETGNIIVSAGAGSGKTRVLTSRIAYLIMEKNVQPANMASENTFVETRRI